MTVAINSLNVDCHDPKVVAEFWSAALEWPILFESDDQVMIAPFDERKPGVFPVLFMRNPDDQAAEVIRLEELGARRADSGQGEVAWVVMADVEGNEFCVLKSLPKDGAG